MITIDLLGNSETLLVEVTQETEKSCSDPKVNRSEESQLQLQLVEALSRNNGPSINIPAKTLAAIISRNRRR